MKYLMTAFLFISTFAHAESLKVKVENFNFTYTNPHGEGSATSFYRNQILGNEAFVSVEKMDNDFKLTVSGSENQEFELKNAPSFMTEAETMTVNGFNLNFADSVTTSLASGRFQSKDDLLALDGLNVACARNLNVAELMDQLLMGCIQSMNFKTSKFSQSGEKVLLHALTSAMGSEKSSFKINSIDLKTSGGKYDLSAEVKAEISGKVKSNGNMSYDPATGTLTLKISEVKFGVLSVRGKVFDELKKKQNEKMKVNEPYVYYKIK